MLLFLLAQTFSVEVLLRLLSVLVLVHLDLLLIRTFSVEVLGLVPLLRIRHTFSAAIILGLQVPETEILLLLSSITLSISNKCLGSTGITAVRRRAVQVAVRRPRLHLLPHPRLPILLEEVLLFMLIQTFSVEVLLRLLSVLLSVLRLLSVTLSIINSKRRRRRKTS